ncbi:TcfC E-set like domain-containing protein [Aeromonas hydrophila]|uniref:TcfC E-set like domain-containing protein n=1 Tax=Aeromonas hydrophila TaxID=644 RepID=UPI0009B8E9BF|nr:TcfC E-set like domain-containing protein [Aeromonas hydrophila]
MIYIKAIFLTVALSFSTLVSSTTYPVEFSDFFAKRPNEVVIRLAGDSIGLKVDALVSYDDFKLSEDGGSSLRHYLLGKGVTNDGIDTIIHELVHGVPANPGCKVNLDECVPEVSDQSITYIFDYDKSSLAIFVGSALLARMVESVTYHPALRANNALVNQARVYGYADESSGGALSLSNLTSLGLPYGHVVFNTQYQSADNTLDVYKGVYDLEIRGTRAIFGYSERDKIFFNTTDFLNDDADYTSYSMQVGSSRNLVRGGSERLQSIFFFAPQAGQLEVYQGDRLLLTKVISQGRQSIAYNNLPTGVYDVRLVLRAGGQTILDEPRQIVNSQQFSLPVGDWDYVLTAGQFSNVPEQDALQWLSSPTNFSKNYSQLRASWRLTDNLLLAGGVTANQDDQYAQGGVSYAWSDWLLATYQAGLFNSGDRYQAGMLTLGPIFLAARRFDSDDRNRAYRLASQLYGEHSFFNYSATYSAALWGGNGYMTYTHYESDSTYTINETRSSNTNDVSAGWMTAWKGWQLGVNANYSKNESYDDLRFGVTASYTLGGGATTQLSMTTDNNGLSRSEAGITKSITHGGWHGSGTASLAWQRDLSTPSEAIISGNVNGRTNMFDASIYGYASSSERRMASGTFSGTQFISNKGIGMTPDMGSSFLNIVPDIVEHSATSEASLDGVHYNVRLGDNATYQGKLTGERSTIPLTPYTETEFVMDAESRNLHIENNILREFVYPGTVYTVDARITPMVTQLFVLNDINDQPIRQVSCVGEACAGVEPLSDDGVFRVNYRAGGEFSLISMNRVCINTPELMKDGAIHTYCLPGLMPEEGRIAFSSSEQINPNDLLYLGKFESRKEARILIKQLKEVGLAVQSVAVGQNLYLYAQNSNSFNIVQRSMLEKLEVYIVLNDANIDELLSVR